MLLAKDVTSILDFPIDISLTIREQVYSFVRQLIMDGRFSPEDRVVVEAQHTNEME